MAITDFGAEMAVTYNLKGTTNPSFKVGKTGNGTVYAENLEATSGQQLLLSGTSLTWTGDIVTNSIVSTNFYINDTADIFLDAAGGDVILKKGGGIQHGYLSNDNDNFVIKASVADKDLIFRGSDSGSEITALTLDMSDAGAATFGGNVTVSGNLTVSGTTTTVNSTTIAVTNSFTFEGATADDFETVLTVTDPTADRTVTIPDATGQIVLRDSTDTLTNKSIDVDNNTVTNIEVDNLKSGVLDTDISSVAGTDTTLASAKAIKTYVDAQVPDDTDGLTEGSSNLYYTDARVQIVSINNLVEDTTPQLGGTLDANGNTIDMGTNVLTDTNLGQFATAYSWGDHSTQNYLSGTLGFPTDLGAVTGSTTSYLGLGPDLGSIATGDTFVGLVKDFGGFSETVRLSGVQTLTNKTITDAASISIANTSTDNSLLITTTENSSTAGPVITLKRNSASPADADYLGQIKFKGENDADQEIVYGKITGKIQDASDGTEDGLIEFANKKAGSNVITARLRSDSLQLLNGTGLTVAGDTTLTGTLNGHTLPGGAGTFALTSSFTHFHSSAQTVTSTQSTNNASGSVDYTFSELSGAIHYVAFLNRTLMRASEYSVSGTTLTVNTGVLATDDQIEVTGISV